MAEATNNETQESRYRPTITDMISLQVPNQVRVSPDGRRVAYAVRTTDWNQNCYENVCYVHDLDRNRSFQLTRSGNVGQFEWFDNESLAVAKAETDGDMQIWLFEGLVGEGIPFTDHKNGVQSFKPYAEGFLFLANDPDKAERKPRAEAFGTFAHFEHEESASALYYVSIPRLKAYYEQQKALTEEQAKKLVKPVLQLSKRLGVSLKICDFVASPQQDAVYLNCRSRDDLVYWDETSAYRLVFDPETALAEFISREQTKQEKDSSDPAHTVLEEQEDASYIGKLTEIALPKGATIAQVSPDGSKLLIVHKGRDNLFYTQEDLWILDLGETEHVLEDDRLADYLTCITSRLDQSILHQEWVKDGILISYPAGTHAEIAHLSESGLVSRVNMDVSPLVQFHANQDGVLGFVGVNEVIFPEVCVATRLADGSGWRVRAVTDLSERTADWDFGTVETIRWKSKDGTEIEGVLRKPSHFDPGKQYPLVFVVHGGPTWFSPAYLLEGADIYYYPTLQFNQRDILVLKPNYRGSIGYGQAFLELNRDNLGVGDLDDLESAIDHLDAQGYIDTSRIGCMGWSQGGYISAFAGTHSARFRAVSVGAGVSDWYTYHIANDIPQFTTHYLSGSPFRNRELYAKTAPMSKIQEAKTPTLIQHGARDQRVPLTNAKELYRGLQEMAVPVELFVFPEMAHPITKPRENRAVMWQNLNWFCHHLLGDELDFFKTENELLST